MADETIKRVGSDAADALRAAAEVLLDSSIPFERRIEAYRRCVLHHAMLSAKFTQMGSRHIMASSLARGAAEANPPASC